MARGAIVAIPTESSYGLAVDPRDAAAVERIYALKRREAGKPLPVVLGAREQLALLPVDAEAEIVRRLAPLWPAALSLLVPLVAALPAAAGEPTVAVRVPAHPGLRELLLALGRPLTATSANLAGEPPLLEPAEVAALLAGLDALVVDGGRLPGGAPSTLVALADGEVRILRRGRYALPDAAVANRPEPPHVGEP